MVHSLKNKQINAEKAIVSLLKLFNSDITLHLLNYIVYFYNASAFYNCFILANVHKLLRQPLKIMYQTFLLICRFHQLQTEQ